MPATRKATAKKTTVTKTKAARTATKLASLKTATVTKTKAASAKLAKTTTPTKTASSKTATVTRTKAASAKPAKTTTASKAKTAGAAKALRVSTHPAKTRTPVSLAIIDKLDAICLALPDATMQVAWGEPTWRVKGKIFAQLDDHHHGAAHVSVWLPAPDGAQQALVDSDPDRFFRPPYVGHKGWVAVVLDTDPDWGMVASLIEQAHGMIAGR